MKRPVRETDSQKTVSIFAIDKAMEAGRVLH
jgi:hypothetical protein